MICHFPDRDFLGFRGFSIFRFDKEKRHFGYGYFPTIWPGATSFSFSTQR